MSSLRTPIAPHLPFTLDEIEQAVHHRNIRQILAPATAEEKKEVPSFVRATDIRLVEEYYDLVYAAADALSKDSRAVLLAREYTGREDGAIGAGPWLYSSAYNALSRWCSDHRTDFNAGCPLHGKRFQLDFIEDSQLHDDINLFIADIKGIEYEYSEASDEEESDEDYECSAADTESLADFLDDEATESKTLNTNGKRGRSRG